MSESKFDIILPNIIYLCLEVSIPWWQQVYWGHKPGDLSDGQDGGYPWRGHRAT